MRKPVYAFIVRCLDCIISLVSVSEISSLYLAFFCGCADQFESTQVANPKDRFSRDEAQIKKLNAESRMCPFLA